METVEKIINQERAVKAAKMEESLKPAEAWWLEQVAKLTFTKIEDLEGVADVGFVSFEVHGDIPFIFVEECLELSELNELSELRRRFDILDCGEHCYLLRAPAGAARCVTCSEPDIATRVDIDIDVLGVEVIVDQSNPLQSRPLIKGGGAARMQYLDAAFKKESERLASRRREIMAELVAPLSTSPDGQTMALLLNSPERDMREAEQYCYGMGRERARQELPKLRHYEALAFYTEETAAAVDEVVAKFAVEYPSPRWQVTLVPLAELEARDPHECIRDALNRYCHNFE